ncbi:MAG: peptide-methionine (S)-S-oxide reductase MsrA [Candidatus Brocadiales bacterium]|nr:peptide-methionine (S)-S-oxide reductase MsrA [Candidatus Brocadiales bacterium]
MIAQILLKSLLLGSLVLSSALKDPANMNKQENQTVASPQGKEVVTLGGGCFWCIAAVFEELHGVEQVESGYSGGWVDDPSYEQVCTGTTGHAEVVQVTFDPKIISLEKILEVFFTVHDPTTLNRQGADVGTQYRSVVFYRSEEQKTTAEQVIREIQKAKLWKAPIVTELVPFKAFYRAEEYHQEYYKKNPGQAYCRIVIEPKIKKFREHYEYKLK